MISGAAHVPGPQGTDAETQAAQGMTAILRLIGRLELEPGSTVTEREIGERLGLRRGPVREALARLMGTGLVAPKTGSGYLVAPITLRQARSLFDLWRALEGLAIEAYGSRAIATRAAEISLGTAFAGDTHDPRDAEFMGILFHVGLAARSGNARLAQALPYWEISRLLRFASTLGDGVACDHAVHKELWEAVIVSDVAAALDISRRHLEDVRFRVLDRLSTADQVQELNLSRAPG